jgi:uncharacterized membrane protein YhaH (DUF805 family)/predicted RNA-binding Zn-ribbon protein involved in translation (DUF1610 family)
MQYYIRIRGKVFGPFDEVKLNDMRTKGKLSRTSEVSENKVEWFSAENLEFLFPLALSETTSSGTSISNSNSGMANLPPSEPAIWFYSVNGTEGFGPVTQTAIVQMIQTGTLRGESLVWQQGQNAQQIRTVQTFVESFSSPVIMPATPVQQQPQQTRFQPENTGLFCASCGNQVVQTAQICPRCGSPISRHKQNYGQNYYPNSFDENYVSDKIGYFDVWAKYAEFQGRARRKEYWNFTLINTFINFVYFIFITFIGGVMLAIEDASVFGLISGILFILYVVFNLVMFLPSLAVMIRRLHDTGNTGWLWLISFIPLVGGIILIIILIQDSQPGDNQYGPNPKYN